MRLEWKAGLLALGTATALALAGCGGGASSNESTMPSAVETSTEGGLFSYNLGGYYDGKVGSAVSKDGALIKTRALELMTGTLEAINTTTGESAVYPWSAYVDLDTFQMTSNKTLAFEPGIYTFNMLLEKEGRQYTGQTQYEIQDTDQVAIPFAINPVIGDRIIDVQVVKELSKFKFRYDVAELNATAVAPKLGVIVDGGSEELFVINPTTGMTESYLSMEEGSHTVGLRYYDGNVLKGKSLTSQESVTITPGEPFNMDIAALHGEAVFALGEVAGEGNITINVPSIVIEEAGALNELRTLLTYSDDNGTLIEEEISLYPNGSDYQGSVVLSPIQYGNATYQLQFFDTGEPTDELLGSCVTEEVNLSATGGTSLCNLELIRRAVNSGNLVATVGVNVLTGEIEPVSGANVYVDGTFKGITGSGTFGTPGYLKLYSIAGEKTFSAEKNSSNLSGSVTESLEVLGVHNVDVVMEEQADINMTGGGFTTLTYIGMGSQRAITGVGFKPDILWLKARDDIGTASFYDNVLYSNGIGSVNYYSVSGDIYLSDFLYMNETNPLGTMNKGRLLHYDEDGFTLSSDNGAAMNITGRKYTAFAWSLPNIRENVSPSGDVQEITPIWEKYSQSMGVSMIEYQGNGRAISKITHSLGKKPEMIMIKNISEHGAWMVYHDAVGSENFLQLNEKNPSSALSSVWSNTEPTSQIFFIGNHENVNKAGKRYVAYLFTTRAGYSKIGSYTGGGPGPAAQRPPSRQGQ